MRSSNESDVVCEQQNPATPKSPATVEFNTWLNGPEVRQEFDYLVGQMSLQGVDPGWARYMLQYGFQGGFSGDVESAPAIYGRKGDMTASEQIGHIAQDLLSDGKVMGGDVMFYIANNMALKEIKAFAKNKSTNDSTEAAAPEGVACPADVGTSTKLVRGYFGGMPAEEFLVYTSNRISDMDGEQLLRMAAYIRVLEEQAGVK